MWSFAIHGQSHCGHLQHVVQLQRGSVATWSNGTLPDCQNKEVIKNTSNKKQQEMFI